MSRSKHPIERIVQDGNCMGCGFCSATYNKNPSEKTTITMKYSPEKDFIIPVVENWHPESGSGSFICPCDEVDMSNLSKQVHGKLPKDYVLGVYKKIRVSYSTDKKLRKKAASGGLIPEILKYLFDTKKISCAYVLHPGNNPYSAKGIIVRGASEISQLHGSVYHPTDFGAALKELTKEDGKFAFVGLPCQIEGLEMYKAKNRDFADKHYISIGLFCGGVNTFKGIEYYLNGYKINWQEVQQIKYREGSWPGKIKVKTNSSGEKIVPRIQDNSRFKILRYMASFQGYWMLKRCRLCPDQINDFADIAVGDPHLKKYKEKKSSGFSAVISRTILGESILGELEQRKKIISENLTRDSLVKTQGYTLDNRRHSLAYLKVNKLLGGKNPNITYYPEVQKNLKFRHYKHAFVDLLKIYLPKNKIIEFFYIPVQIFEYLFITLVPSIIVERLRKIITNK